MKFSLVLLFVLVLCAGCSKPPEPVSTLVPVAADQLIPTLKDIAKTGEFEGKLNSLTAGLEEKGLMDQAVAVQSFSRLTPAEVKKAAADLVKQLEKRAKSAS